MRETQRVTFYRFDLIFATRQTDFSLSPLFPCHQRLLLGLKLECKCGIVSSWFGDNKLLLTSQIFSDSLVQDLHQGLPGLTYLQPVNLQFPISTRHNSTVKNSGKVSAKHFMVSPVFGLRQADFISSLSPLFPRRRRLPPGLAWL